MANVPPFPPLAAPSDTAQHVQQLLSLLTREENRIRTAATMLVPLTADQVQRVLSLLKKEEEKKNRRISVCLDDDILFKILQRLEADILFNLRVVSKQWHNLIFDPYFVISHLSYEPPPGLLVQTQSLLYGSYKLGFLDLKGEKIVMRYLGIDVEKPVIASCNGLVLFRNYPNRGDYSVGNLFNRKGKILPLHNYDDDSYLDKVLGFTYVKDTGEYKIVCLMCKKDYSIHWPMIFTLGANTWTQVKESEPAHHFWNELGFVDFNEEIADRYLCMLTPVCINNFLHVLVESEHVEGEEVLEVLVTIDTKNGIFHKNLLPFESESRGELINFGGVLGFHVNYNNQINIWVLKDLYKKEWIQVHSLQIEDAPYGFESPLLLGNLGNGEVLLYSDNGSCDSCHVLHVNFFYALDVESQKVIKRFPLPLDDRRFCLQHVNTLISIKSL